MDCPTFVFIFIMATSFPPVLIVILAEKMVVFIIQLKKFHINTVLCLNLQKDHMDPILIDLIIMLHDDAGTSNLFVFLFFLTDADPLIT